MFYIVLSIILLAGIAGITVGSINFKNLKKHSREGKLGVSVGFLLLAAEVALCFIGIISTISFFSF